MLESIRAETSHWDAYFAVHRGCDLGRLAVVSNVRWLQKRVRLLVPTMRGDVRIFDDDETGKAKARLASTNGQKLANRSRSALR